MNSHPVSFVIMAGGRGERLWPLVRAANPKVCASLDGTGTLLQATLARLGPLTRRYRASTMVVTTADQVRPIRQRLPNGSRLSLVAEPQPKNTAACILLAAAALAHRHPETILAILPADHWIRPTAAWQRAITTAIERIRQGAPLALVGIKPTRVHSGLGHLVAGPILARRGGCRVFRMARFVEKPTPAQARALLQTPRTYWNGGMFVARARHLLALAQRWLPDHAAKLIPLGALVGRASFTARARHVYHHLRPVSFDDGIMAHAPQAEIVEGRFAWEDLGSWDSWIRTAPPRAPMLAIGGRDVRAVGPADHVVVTVGVDRVIVVHTPDATLVCDVDQAQHVREAVNWLSQRRHWRVYT